MNALLLAAPDLAALADPSPRTRHPDLGTPQLDPADQPVHPSLFDLESDLQPQLR